MTRFVDAGRSPVQTWRRSWADVAKSRADMGFIPDLVAVAQADLETADRHGFGVGIVRALPTNHRPLLKAHTQLRLRRPALVLPDL